MQTPYPYQIAILGSGTLGTDLLLKIQRTPELSCTAFVGRRPDSKNLLRAQALGVPTSSEGIRFLEANRDTFDVVVDATSAEAHRLNYLSLQAFGKPVLDLTPSNLSPFCIPAINLQEALSFPELSLVTCGGQATIPLASAIAKSGAEIEKLEVVSMIASESAGPATRKNIDAYIETTEAALRQFTQVKNVKVILHLNPAKPPVCMQTTLFVKGKNWNFENVQTQISTQLEKLKYYVPGYELVVLPTLSQDKLTVMIRVKGAGDYLPVYSGNLDIINCAALAILKAKAAQREARLPVANSFKDHHAPFN